MDRFTIIPTQKGISIEQAEKLSGAMDIMKDESAPDDIQAGAFFFLLAVKQHMLEEELYEQLAEFYKLEQIHEIDIPTADPN